MNRRKSGFSINVGSKLTGIALVVAIAGFLFVNFLTIKSVSIGSSSYADIALGKDFVAHLLPPSLYPIDAFADAHILDGDPQLYDEIAPRLLENKKAYYEHLKNWNDRLGRSAAINQSEWAEFNQQFVVLGDRFWAELEGKLLPAVKSKNAMETGSSIDRMLPIIADFRTMLAKLNTTISSKIAANEVSAIETASSRQVMLMVIGAIIIAFVMLVVYVAQSYVVKALGRLDVAMRKLADGELETEVPFTQRKDEIGNMSHALDIFKSNALKGREDKKNLEHVVQVVGNSLNALARGDLTHRITERLYDSTDRLRISFNTAAEDLASVIAVVKNGADGMRSGTEEIAQASDDLSRRTESQAANLEETAAAVAEIVETVRKTANGAGHARKVVSIAKDEADKSGEVVRKAVDAMHGIEKSSLKINQIIGVIDEIAFQTSLLALNAGVEAARAGDAGRGFAVVATEVRALAQRSADAAKEIKELLSASRSKVEQGVQLVGDTGLYLKNIIERVAEINSVVSEIAAGAEQQASSLQEVNAAVDQMDQVTQQNAAMVEQATAASRTLTHQSAELAQMVAKFTTVAVIAVARASRPASAQHVAAPRAPVVPPRRMAATGTSNASGWEEF